MVALEYLKRYYINLISVTKICFCISIRSFLIICTTKMKQILNDIKVFVVLCPL